MAASYFAFVSGFALSYFQLRNWRSVHYVSAAPSDAADLKFVIVLAITVKAGLLVFSSSFGEASSTDYISSYLTFRNRSVIVQQFAGLLLNIDFAATVLLIVTATAHSSKARLIVGTAVVAEVLFVTLFGGSRSSSFLHAFAFVVALSFYGVRLTGKWLALLGSLGLAAFLTAGLLRSGVAEEDSPVGLRFLQDGEFMAVYVTSLDLLGRLKDPEVGWLQERIYFVDLLRLVPHQLAGQLKVDPAAYYASAFYPSYSEAGGWHSAPSLRHRLGVDGSALPARRAARLGLCVYRESMSSRDS